MTTVDAETYTDFVNQPTTDFTFQKQETMSALQVFLLYNCSQNYVWLLQASFKFSTYSTSI